MYFFIDSISSIIALYVKAQLRVIIDFSHMQSSADDILPFLVDKIIGGTRKRSSKYAKKMKIVKANYKFGRF